MTEARAVKVKCQNKNSPAAKEILGLLRVDEKGNPSIDRDDARPDDVSEAYFKSVRAMETDAGFSPGSWKTTLRVNDERLALHGRSVKYWLAEQNIKTKGSQKGAGGSGSAGAGAGGSALVGPVAGGVGAQTPSQMLLNESNPAGLPGGGQHKLTPLFLGDFSSGGRAVTFESAQLLFDDLRAQIGELHRQNIALRQFVDEQKATQTQKRKRDEIHSTTSCQHTLLNWFAFIKESFLRGEGVAKISSRDVALRNDWEFMIQSAVVGNRFSEGRVTGQTLPKVRVGTEDYFFASGNDDGNYDDIQFKDSDGNICMAIELKTLQADTCMLTTEQDRAVRRCVRHMEESPNLTTLFFLVCERIEEAGIKKLNQLVFSDFKLSTNQTYKEIAERVTQAIRTNPHRANNACVPVQVTITAEKA